MFSVCCPASQVFPDCSDSEKDLLEVFSICCPASQVCADIPTHRTLQQEAQSNSCFPNASSCLHLDVSMMWHCHQPLASVSFHCFHIHLCSSPSQLPGEMRQEAWWDRCFWGPGTQGIRGCERLLGFMADFSRQCQYNPRVRQVYVYLYTDTQNPMWQRTVLTQSVGEQSVILARN